MTCVSIFLALTATNNDMYQSVATNNDMYQSVAKLAKKVISISYALIVIHRQDGYIFTSNPWGSFVQS